MIPVWGGTENVHMKKLQKIINTAARYVLNDGRRWRTNRLLTACNWLGARELSDYHSLITLSKVINFEVLSQLREKFTWMDDRRILTNPPRLFLLSIGGDKISLDLENFDTSLDSSDLIPTRSISTSFKSFQATTSFSSMY